MILSGITTGGQKTYEIVSNKVKYKLSINDITEIYERLNHTKSSNVQNIVNDYVKDLKNVQEKQSSKVTVERPRKNFKVENIFNKSSNYYQIDVAKSSKKEYYKIQINSLFLLQFGVYLRGDCLYNRGMNKLS